MLGTKYGFAQSTDCACAVQTMDPYFVRQSMDFVCNPWISKGAKDYGYLRAQRIMDI